MRIDDDALVHQDVFLQRALEVVAEGGVGAGGGQVAVVGLHEAALADLVVLHLVADGDDAAGDLVAGHGGLVAGDVAGDLGEDVRASRPLTIFALARVLGELLEQLQVGEAQADGLDLGRGSGAGRA